MFRGHGTEPEPADERPDVGCAFCDGPTERELFELPVCSFCHTLYWTLVERMCGTLVERMCADGSSRPDCEGCGAESTEVVDGHPFCAECHEPVAAGVTETLLTLQLRGTMREIQELPARWN
jgi:hypothetical protein